MTPADFKFPVTALGYLEVECVSRNVRPLFQEQFESLVLEAAVAFHERLAASRGVSLRQFRLTLVLCHIR